MAPKTKILKNCVIAYTDDLAIAKRDRIKGWVEHAGGKISKDITDDVTHLILTARDWNEYKPKVKDARSRKTIYLVRLAWLEDSLLDAINKSKSKPLDECEKKYTWEVRHAERVLKHRDIKKAEKKKAALVTKMLAARQEQELAEEGGDIDTQMDEAVPPSEDAKSGEDSQNEGGSSSGSAKVGLNIKAGLGKRGAQGGIRKKRNINKKIVDAERIQQVFECGIKLDKSILETERQMAAAGYRPYIDSNGSVYMIMLVRDDIEQILQEQYTLKRSTSPVDFQHGGTLPTELDNIVIKDPATRKRRRRAQRRASFTAGENTRLRYLEDPICCSKSRAHSHSSASIDRLNDGQCTPGTINEFPFKNHRTVTEWVNDLPQHNPSLTGFRQPSQNISFSSLAIMPYTPMSTLHPEIRVPLPQPFAYSLQLYESIELAKSCSDHEQSGTSPTMKTEPPSPTNASDSLASFTQYLPQVPQDTAQTEPSPESQSPISPTTTSTSTSSYLTETSTLPPPKKTYLLICQYTRKSKSKVSETTVLAPEGSTFQFAMDLFRKIFRKKTGLSWEEVRGGDGNESGIKRSGNMGERDSDTGSKSSETSPGAISNEELTQHDSDNLSLRSSTIQGDGPVPDSISTEPTHSTTTNTTPTSPALHTAVPQTSDPNTTNTMSESATLNSTTPPTPTPWSLSTSKDVGRAGYRPFRYIPTDRKIFEDGNEKYKGIYGEDLFLFDEENDGTFVKREGDGAD